MLYHAAHSGVYLTACRRHTQGAPGGRALRLASKHAHDYVYTIVFRDIIRGIASRAYCDQQLLPPIEQLSKTYHVSYATIRKVLKQLNDIGLAKTYNGLGTRIQLHNGTAQACVKDSTMIRDALQFMGAIQFITMTIARCSLEYFEQLLVLALLWRSGYDSGIMTVSDF
ncbi:MAG: GntR family transcriptional regulator [Clostridium sp.]